MSLKSMTGFARAEGGDDTLAWAWELRSVNGRGLDLRLRMAPGYEALEPQVRELVGKSLSRGSLSVGLSAQRRGGGGQIRVNQEALEQVLSAAEYVRQITGCERPRAEGLLALRGVLEPVEEGASEEIAEARRAAMLATLGEAIEGMVTSRAAEGARLASVLLEQVAEIEEAEAETTANEMLVEEAEADLESDDEAAAEVVAEEEAGEELAAAEEAEAEAELEEAEEAEAEEAEEAEASPEPVDEAEEADQEVAAADEAAEATEGEAE